MRYCFGLEEKRKIQAASHCLFDKPILHPDRNMPVHDLVYMVDGEWTVGMGEERFTMKNGDVLILPAGIRHFGIKPCSPNTKTMYFHVYSTVGDGSSQPSSGDGSVILNSLIHCGGDGNIKELFRKIIRTQGDASVVSAYVTSLLYELSLISHEASVASLARGIHDYITSVDIRVTSAEIAKRFNVSTRTAELAFKAEYGMTMQRFALRGRLEKGKRYLTDYPNMKICSVAAALGFCDEFHFSKAFKREFGVSPAGYKKGVEK